MSSKSRRPPDQEEVASLTEAVRELAQHVQVLYQAIDEFREQYAWSLENGRPPPPVVLTSMPVDPAAPDWAERLNRMHPADVPSEMQAPENSTAHQQNFWK